MLVGIRHSREGGNPALGMDPRVKPEDLEEVLVPFGYYGKKIVLEVN